MRLNFSPTILYEFRYRACYKESVIYIIYSKEGCVNCERAKALLLSKGIDYEEVRLDTDDGAWAVSVLIERGVRQLPFIEFDDEAWGRTVGGLEELRKELF